MFFGFFAALLSIFGSSAAGGAAAGAGAAAGGAVAGGAAAGGAAAGAGAAVGGAAAGAGTGALLGETVGAITEGSAVAPLNAAQAALTSVPAGTQAGAATTPAATPAATVPTSATSATPAQVAAEHPAIQELIRPSPEAVMSQFTGPQYSGSGTPQLSEVASKATAPGGSLGAPTGFGGAPTAPYTGTGFGSTPAGATGGGYTPAVSGTGTTGLVDKLKELWNSKTGQELRETYSKIQDLQAMSNEDQARQDFPEAPSQARANVDLPPMAIPELQRAETVGGLNLQAPQTASLASSPASLSTSESENILNLIQQLRLRGRGYA